LQGPTGPTGAMGEKGEVGKEGNLGPMVIIYFLEHLKSIIVLQIRLVVVRLQNLYFAAQQTFLLIVRKRYRLIKN